MPTYEGRPEFWRDYARLTPQQRVRFRAAVRRFIRDLESGRFRAGLRVRAVAGAPGVYEMTWADDGRATFEYGAPVRAGDVHIVWRRCGTHDIFDAP